MGGNPAELPSIETHIVISSKDLENNYRLTRQIESRNTLAAFQRANLNIRRGQNPSETQFIFKLPALEAIIFPLVINWLNGEPFLSLDPRKLDAEIHVSEWCVLHVLAQRFCISELADEALERYRDCPSHFRQGTWLPLSSEIEYLYQYEDPTIQVRNHIAMHFMSQMLSSKYQGALHDLESLMATHIDFDLEVRRAMRQHQRLGIRADEPCGVDECLEHYQWSPSDIAVVEQPPSPSPECAESEVDQNDGTLVKEEDDMAASEILEALEDGGEVNLGVDTKKLESLSLV